MSAPPLQRARVVSVEEAAWLLENGASVIDARSEKAFVSGHLPSSQRMDWRDWTEERPGLMHYLFGHPERWGRVPQADALLQERLRALGLDDVRPVLVVGEPHAYGEEGRIAWNLLFWGAREVALLEGGFAAWASSGRTVETGAARKVAPGSFTIRPQRHRIAELEDVKAALGNADAVILDARSEAEWQGKTVAGQKRGGHLPGARLVPQLELYTEEGRYLDAKALCARIGGFNADAAPITYCVGGVRSALLAFLVEARLGVTTRNYAGSIWEYAAQKELPLEHGG